MRRLRGLLRRDDHSGIPPELIIATEEDKRHLARLYDDSVPPPEGAERELSPDNPRLHELKRTYAQLDLPVQAPSRWNDQAVGSFLDLTWFRGETLFYWHYRELPRISRLKFFVWARYLEDRDPLGLLERLDEDGLFGCWTFDYPGRGRYSRDLLESVNELLFLERELGLSERERFSVLDVGAGYGRLAHRMTAAFDSVTDYCCVDAVPESTFISDYYLRFRGCAPPARVVPLDRVGVDLSPGAFDLAVNIHSWSECPLAAAEWWIAELARLEVPRVLVVPNQPTELLSLEADGSRRDLTAPLERAGYGLVKREPVIVDAAVRELIRLDDHFHLFERAD